MKSTAVLSRTYTGTTARRYDEDRVGTARDMAEQAAVRAALALAKPSDVLDCPCGTGRFFGAYAEAGVARVIGADVSADMMAIARTRAGELGLVMESQAIDLLGDTAAVSRTLGQVDTVVCVRFLNWIAFDRVTHVLRALTPVARTHLIVGVTMSTGREALGRRIKKAIRRLLPRAGAWRNKAFAHPEKDVTALFASLGLRIVDRRETFALSDRHNDIYLLARE